MTQITAAMRWGDLRALSSYGDREPAEPWSWHDGAARRVVADYS